MIKFSEVPMGAKFIIKDCRDEDGVYAVFEKLAEGHETTDWDTLDRQARVVVPNNTYKLGYEVRLENNGKAVFTLVTTRIAVLPDPEPELKHKFKVGEAVEVVKESIVSALKVGTIAIIHKICKGREAKYDVIGTTGWAPAAFQYGLKEECFAKLKPKN